MEDLLTGEYLLYKSLCGIDFGVHLKPLLSQRQEEGFYSGVVRRCQESSNGKLFLTFVRIEVLYSMLLKKPLFKEEETTSFPVNLSIENLNQMLTSPSYHRHLNEMHMANHCRWPDPEVQKVEYPYRYPYEVPLMFATLINVAAWNILCSAINYRLEASKQKYFDENVAAYYSGHPNLTMHEVSQGLNYLDLARTYSTDATTMTRGHRSKSMSDIQPLTPEQAVAFNRSRERPSLVPALGAGTAAPIVSNPLMSPAPPPPTPQKQPRVRPLSKFVTPLSPATQQPARIISIKHPNLLVKAQLNLGFDTQPDGSMLFRRNFHGWITHYFYVPAIAKGQLFGAKNEDMYNLLIRMLQARDRDVLAGNDGFEVIRSNDTMSYILRPRGRGQGIGDIRFYFTLAQVESADTLTPDKLFVLAEFARHYHTGAGKCGTSWRS